MFLSSHSLKRLGDIILENFVGFLIGGTGYIGYHFSYIGFCENYIILSYLTYIVRAQT